MARLARQRLASFGNVEVEIATFEEWNGGRRFKCPGGRVVVALDRRLGWLAPGS